MRMVELMTPPIHADLEKVRVRASSWEVKRTIQRVEAMYLLNLFPRLLRRK
ncbi:MAG: hypothetical protein WC180_01185 [Candidatus Paceibacterota bacterium]